eukprot:210603_1
MAVPNSNNSAQDRESLSKKRKVCSNLDPKCSLAFENEYLKEFKRVQAAMPKDMHRLLDPSLDDQRRSELFDCLDPDPAERFSWAVPDERALRICAEFSPIVEVGAGRGYWGKLLLDRGVDYVGFDHVLPDPEDEIQNWCDIQKGSEEVLESTEHQNRTLFLCYPDDFEHSEESLGLKCLEVFKGDTVIIVGEMLGETVLQNPWGKTVSSECQEELNANFHKILQVPLPSWQCSQDSLTVWKRTTYTQVDDMHFRHVAPEETIRPVLCCERTRHLI